MPLDEYERDSPTHFPSSDADEAEYSLLMDYPEEADYYALLGLAREPAPTDAEIRSAYRNLTLSFHPDKQPAELREAAQGHFGQIQEAYETLIDPRKRAVYDLLGAEGVRREWARGGAMGMGGEAEKQVGVKAQTPEEFRAWFLETMKRRERRLVNSMVQSRGSLSLGIDASDMISVDEYSGDVFFHVPSPQMSSYAVGYSFKAPFPTPEVLFGKETEDDDEEVEGESTAHKTASFADEPETEISFNAGFSGTLKQSYREVQLQMQDDSIVTRTIPLPLLGAGRDINLGASVNRSFGDVASMKGILARRPFTFLSNSAVAVNASLLPTPLLQATVGKAFSPIRGTRPFQVNMSAIIANSLLKTPPMLAMQVTKGVGERKHAFCSWSSGTIFWPHVLEVLFSPIAQLGADTDWLVGMSAFSQMSRFQIGLISTPKRPQKAFSMDDEGDEEELEEDEEELEYRRLQKKDRDEADVAESWQSVITATPAIAGISLTYARNIFNGKASNDPVRSEWSSEGHYSLPPAIELRSVRVEIQSTVNLDLSLAWNISGIRQVGRFTRLGFGVGIDGNRGLVMTASWSRLGQSIKLPVAVCPFESANADAAALAVVFPWVAYCAFEFLYNRPRERRARRRAIVRRQKQLRKLVPKKRAESQQAIELMAEQTQRRQAREESQGGLIITKAEYGHFPSSKKANDSSKDSEIADVTIPVAALVDRGQLVIQKGTVKFHILGFYDPAPLLPKKLRIWYTYHGKEHYVEVNDSEGVACPMRTHLLYNES